MKTTLGKGILIVSYECHKQGLFICSSVGRLHLKEIWGLEEGRKPSIIWIYKLNYGEKDRWVIK